MQNQEILQQAADQARGLAIDAVHACSSGHLGLPLGAAEVGSVLFGHDLQVDPSDAEWINRDRFVLFPRGGQKLQAIAQQDSGSPRIW